MDYSYFNEEQFNETKTESLPKKNSTFIWFLKIITPTLLAYLYYSLYSGTFDHLIYDTELVFIATFIILFVIPALTYYTFKLWVKSENGLIFGIILTCLSVLIGGPFFGYWSGKHEQELYKKSGVVTNAIVTEYFYNHGDRMYYQFYVNDDIYTSFNVSNVGGYLAGDTIKIIYNKENPGMNASLDEIKRN